jgi:hypothetical protein
MQIVRGVPVANKMEKVEKEPQEYALGKILSRIQYCRKYESLCKLEVIHGVPTLGHIPVHQHSTSCLMV